MTTNASIHPTDLLTVAVQGATTQTITMSGMDSLTSVWRHVRSASEGRTGVVKVVIRNHTRGWAQQHTLVFKSQAEPSKGVSKGGFHASYPTLF